MTTMLEATFKLPHWRRRRLLALLSGIRLPDRTQALVVTGGAAAFLGAVALCVSLSLASYRETERSSAAPRSPLASSQQPPGFEAEPYPPHLSEQPVPDIDDRLVLPVEDEI